MKFLRIDPAAAALTAACVFFVGAASADGQTNRRRTNVRPAAVVTPTPADAEIISRASDFPPESQPTILDPAESIASPAGQPAPVQNDNDRINELNERIRLLEDDRKQKRLLLNLDILTRAEQRAESLRKQRFEMIEKESTINSKLDQINADLRPEMIERTTAMTGSLRPEELRSARKRSLESEKNNLETLLREVQATRSNLEMSVQKADQLVERLRVKLEKDIDDSLADDPVDQ